MMNTPDYARTKAFSILLELCQRAGLDVQFVELPTSVYGRSRDRLIQMPVDNRFFSNDHAAIVLGHELAHFLVNPNFPEIANDERPTLERSMLLESECDRLGTYLYALAKSMAEGVEERGEAEALEADVPLAAEEPTDLH